MLKLSFKRRQKYKVVLYARMSSRMQNPRSPEQQIATIKGLIKSLNLPWEVIAIYRDDAISGRYSKKRKGYQKMLHDLKSGAVQAQILLVDTFERLSRADDNAEVRRKLSKAGVLVLTADSQFEDPTSVSGRALAFVESFRASEESRIKGHNVLRGKKDAVLLGRWPGGPIPFGFRLKNVMVMRNGVNEPDYKIIEPIPELKWIIELIFNLSANENLGSSRICKRLNNHPDLQSGTKSFTPATISSILANELYYGEMIWGKNCTGVVDDIRLLQKLPAEDWARNPDFCKAIVPKELWDRSMQMISARCYKTSVNDNRSQDEEDSAILRPRGVALKYPLSGLVTCASCGRSMVTSSSSAYVAKSGDERRYISYVCPGHHFDDCDNHCRVPEGWLRETVIQLVCDRLFPKLK